MNPYPSPQAALDDFSRVIDQLAADLQLYAARQQPNYTYMDKQNMLIRHLTEIYNGITALQHYDAWTAVETRMLSLVRQDANLCGHTIHLRTKPDGNNFSLIEYDPFSD